MIYRYLFKRLIDIVLSFVGIIVLAPIMFFIAVLIKIDDPGPVFFKQKRVGQYKKYFYMRKFRSMKTATPKDVPTHLLINAESYISRVGKILRKYSLDELPQLLHILVGEMSIVGPRPALWNQYDLIKARDKYKANVLRPGLTGWAQVNGRDELPINVKAKLDGEYAQKISFKMDLKCFIMTIFKVAKSDGVVEGAKINKVKKR